MAYAPHESEGIYSSMLDSLWRQTEEAQKIADRAIKTYEKKYSSLRERDYKLDRALQLFADYQRILNNKLRAKERERDYVRNLSTYAGFID